MITMIIALSNAQHRLLSNARLVASFWQTLFKETSLIDVFIITTH